MVDNGPLTRRYNGPFRGTKTGVHEGGIRSPFYTQWPARLKPGLSSDRITAHIDVMPTLLDAANIPLPAHVTLDGRSFLPLLEGRKSPWPDRHIVIQSHRGDTPVRYHHFAIRSQQWKLVHPTGFGRETPPTDVPFELYDISQDLGESHNLASERPEVVARLKTAYDTWFDDVSHTRPNNYDPPRIVVGTDHETRTVLTWEDWRVPGSSGWGHLGTWWLRFESEQSYDIELLWPQAIDPCTIELSVGDLQKSQEMTQTASRTVFNNLTVPPGKASLQVKVLRNGEVKDPYQVILHRR
jgi:arylsulfatase/arylsulfatase A